MDYRDHDGGETPEDRGAPAPRDPNLVAVDAAGLEPDMTAWLHDVAAQVDPRLDRVAVDWRTGDRAQAARACAFGLLLGYLGRGYPHVRGDLARVAEAHPSFSTLETGRRLAILEEIVGDLGRTTAWLGPLVGVDDPQRMRVLFD